MNSFLSHNRIATELMLEVFLSEALVSGKVKRKEEEENLHSLFTIKAVLNVSGQQ